MTKDEQGAAVLDSRRFLADNLVYPAAHFDVVLCWNLPDYLDESLVRPVMGRLWSVLKPGGMLLAFFTRKMRGRIRRATVFTLLEKIRWRCSGLC